MDFMFDYLRPVMILMMMYFFLNTNCYFSFKKNNTLYIKSFKNKLKVSLLLGLLSHRTENHVCHPQIVFNVSII